MTPEQLAEIEHRLQQAQAEVYAIAAGTKRWTMKVPAQEGSDSDLVIDAALNDAATLLAEVKRLQKRLKAAEDVAVMFGWTGVGNSERSKAASTLYGRWVDIVGLDFAGPGAHPDLSVPDLAREYDENRARNLAKIRGEDA